MFRTSSGVFLFPPIPQRQTFPDSIYPWALQERSMWDWEEEEFCNRASEGRKERSCFPLAIDSNGWPHPHKGHEEEATTKIWPLISFAVVVASGKFNYTPTLLNGPCPKKSNL